MSSGNRNDDEILDKSMLSNEESGLEKVKIVNENRDSRLNDADGVCDKDVLVNGGIMNGDDGIEADNVNKEDVVSKDKSADPLRNVSVQTQVNSDGLNSELLNSGTDNETHVEDVVKEVNDNNQKGEEVVRFEEELVREGCEKWKYTVCGYFVDCRMPVYELKYNIRMMWGRLGLKDIVVDTDEMCFFKFKSKEEMNNVLDQSPGLVNGKPLIVQKWDSEITIVKEAPCKIPLWIRLFNVLLEAWSVKEISIIASRLGRPIKIDKMTADMCKEGLGRLGYVRVLVEVDARKEYVDKVEIDYVDNQMNVKRTKWVRARYSCKPERCIHCRVFGHGINSCRSKLKKVNDDDKGANKQIIRGNNNEEFVEVKNRRNKWRNNNNFNKRVQGNNIPARRDNVTANVKYAFKPKEPVHKPVETPAKENPKSGGTASNRKIRSDKAWRISNENDKELSKSANKYAVLSDDENGSNGEEEFTYKRLIVEEFIRKKLQPTYSDDEDVYENKNEAIQNIIPNEGMCNELKQKEVRKFILDDSIQVIMIGWNPNVVDVMAIHSSCHELLCLIEDVQGKIKLYVSFIYASNSNGERKILWRQLAHGLFLPYVVSDHSPAILIVPKGLPKKKKSFRGCKMFKVVKKLKNLKKPLNELNWKNGNLYDNVVKFKHQLKEAQSKVEADPFNLNNKLEVVELLNKYNKAAENELKLLNQIAKVKWLKKGDRNSAYFLSILKARRHKNRVETICGEDDVRYNGSNVANQFVNHFKNFLGKSIPVKPLSSLGDIVLLKLSEEDVTRIIEKVSGDEIKDALFGIDSTKAAGPDGKMLGEVNATLIALVPKIDTPDKVSDFRRIAYCNVLYKCISEILTNRINNGLYDLLVLGNGDTESLGVVKKALDLSRLIP
ncbi:RNA-directed DNA polymerase, eukaryota, reverse transcriptase zinc-binding domain protein [Tanacetum coccineum]